MSASENIDRIMAENLTSTDWDGSWNNTHPKQPNNADLYGNFPEGETDSKLSTMLNGIQGGNPIQMPQMPPLGRPPEGFMMPEEGYQAAPPSWMMDMPTAQPDQNIGMPAPQYLDPSTFPEVPEMPEYDVSMGQKMMHAINSKMFPNTGNLQNWWQENKPGPLTMTSKGYYEDGTPAMGQNGQQLQRTKTFGLRSPLQNPFQLKSEEYGYGGQPYEVEPEEGY